MPHGVYEPAWTRYLKPPRWLRNRLERRVLEGAAAVHMFFDSEVPDIRTLAPCAGFITIPTGFDIPEERWSGGGGYLGWIGRIDPVHKGLDVLIGAIADAAPAERPVLRIRGYDYKGGARAYCIDRCPSAMSHSGCGSRDLIAGDEKSHSCSRADGYIHPSRWECHSIALLENLAMGVPCLVSDAIHIAHTLRQRAPPSSASRAKTSLATSLLRLRQTPGEIARRGRELISAAFNWNVLMPKFQSCLGSLGLQ